VCLLACEAKAEQEIQALQSQKTTGAKEYGDKLRAINAKKDVIRAKEAQWRTRYFRPLTTACTLAGNKSTSGRPRALACCSDANNRQPRRRLHA
jgi:hypothetical protein